MYRVYALTLLLVAGVFTGCAMVSGAGPVPVGELTPAPEGAEWIDLFAAEHAPKWQNVTDSAQDIFSIANEELHISGGNGTRYIAYTGEEFGDFAMHVEFKLAAGVNSGVFFRTSKADPVYAGMEIQVFEDHGQPPNVHSAGALYDVATPMFNLSKPAGEWNSYDITCQGSSLTVVMNGWKVLDLDLAKFTTPVGKFPTPLAELPRRGHIILQDHEGEVTFRNLLIKKL